MKLGPKPGHKQTPGTRKRGPKKGYKQTPAHVKKQADDRRGKKYKIRLKPDDHKISGYNLTVGEYNAMFRDQKGLCAICGKKETRKSRHGGICKLSIDHSHTTGKVRGLLCIKCNFGIGQFDEDVERLLKTIKYLNERK